MPAFPDDIDLQAFWEDSDYARGNVTGVAPDDDLVASLEAELGYRLPASYLAFMRRHNGGIPHNCCFPTAEATSWAEDHVAIAEFLSIGRDKSYSIGGELGSRFHVEEWGYPDLGVYICSCPSAGHDMVALDYRRCGPGGEPQVVHVDQEADYRVTFLADDFESFVRGLVPEDAYDTSLDDYEDGLLAVTRGAFSPALAPLLEDFGPLPRIAEAMRAQALRILEEKRHFLLHGDPGSWLMYDLQFWVYQRRHRVEGCEDYLRDEAYPALVAMADTGFSTGGHAPGFVADWFDARLAAGELVRGEGGIAFSAAHEAKLHGQALALLDGTHGAA
ncbi:SMI1/KNR4 family protein [Flavobacterium sp. MXW15]|uniref:SMI1/KNR4 family protein n=1 Tax=Xanthomonas chitinilytica TaxID=2989819 RepID=A0ABT3JW30_9XANT|nr:SMI1/KNR4 family protein [Xanthomonas sp. H13-6]MCW4455138.1 SMI1/KNR4 family protein [Flavobacterium sp. MXW15]MCW4472696.1 SMI1/KNR4 family protein [Xanthomonas sp. H13-6]